MNVGALPVADIGRLAGALKPEYTEALQAIHVQGTPVKAFAEQKGLSVSNAGVRVFRARQAVKKRLDRYDMHIGAFRVEPLEYTDLDENKQRQLEDARTRILNLVTALERQREPPVFRESLTFEAEPSTETRKELIHKLELRLAKIPSDRLLAARDSLEWSLDRIAFYAAFGARLLPNVPLSDLVSALKREEEQPVNPIVAERLSEV